MLELDHVTIAYGETQAVEDFSLHMEPGEIVSLVGESGSGKTSVIRGILGLLPGGGAVTQGNIVFDGKDLLDVTPEQWRTVRGREISMIFQDSGAMMNPTRKIGAVFAEYLRTQMLARMRLPSPENIMCSYPFQLSGGMQQRVGIAMAMSYEPKLLLADEPTSALDVTTQAQIVGEMARLRRDYGTAILLVTHNLGVAAYLSDRIMVMRQGRIEEAGNRDTILQSSTNAYTRSLLESVPTLGGVRYV